MKGNLKSSHGKFKKESKKTLYQGFNTKKKPIKAEGDSIKDSISHRLNLPADLISDAPIVISTGRNQLSIENYRSIIEYNDKIVKIQTKAFKITVEGTRLNILYFAEDEMKITGFINSITYL